MTKRKIIFSINFSSINNGADNGVFGILRKYASKVYINNNSNRLGFEYGEENIRDVLNSVDKLITFSHIAKLTYNMTLNNDWNVFAGCCIRNIIEDKKLIS